MAEKYKILEVGNFYLPYLDIKKKFIVEDILDIKINRKNAKRIEEALNSKNIIYLRTFAEIIWESINNELKKDLKNYKNCWFVPTMISKLDKEYICSVDVLRKG